MALSAAQVTEQKKQVEELLGPDLDTSYRTCAATHRPLA